MTSTKEYPNPEEWIVILGSGASINDLPENLIDWANKTRARIAINKYGAFYEKAGILPTDIYFHDFHDKTSEYFFYRTLKKSKKVAKCFYVSPLTAKFLTKSRLYFLYLYLLYLISLNSSFFLKISNISIRPFSQRSHKRLIAYFRDKKKLKPILLQDNEIVKIDVHYLWDAENKWANTMDDKLFHFRGSLTSVLNLVSLKYNNLNVLMLGVDLITKEYFFDKEIEKIFTETGLGYDWSQAFMDNSGKHYSAAVDSGVTIFDRFDYVVDCLNQSNNAIYAYPNENAQIFNGLVKSF